MDEISSETLLQLTVDELGEVLEELTGAVLNDHQIEVVRQLIETAGSLEAALDMLTDISPDAEAA